MTAYAELAAVTNYSFLRGASHPLEMVGAAGQLGYAGIGIADRNTLAGVVRAHVAAKEYGVRLAVGSRLVFADGTPDILAYPKDRAAYGRLCRLLTTGNRRAEKGDCILTVDDLKAFSEGLRLIAVPPRRRLPAFDAQVKTLAGDLPDQLWLGVTMPRLGDDRRRLAGFATLAKSAGIKPIALGDPLYHTPERRPLQDIVTCVREHVTIDEAGFRLEQNAERHLKRPEEMERLFADLPQAVSETVRFLDGLGFSLDELKYEYPREAFEGYATAAEALRALVEEGVKRRFPEGVDEAIRKTIEHELAIIAQKEYEPYFLTVYDIVRYARSQSILCQGRGSAANSVVCYCLGITDVDPRRGDLLFERFISIERDEPPDIDVDFEHGRREEVMQYIYQRYGREKAGIAATVITYRGRSAVREVGKVFGLTDDAVTALSGSVWGSPSKGLKDDDARRTGFDPTEARLAMVLKYAGELSGFPRHLSQHVGGFVLTAGRLDEAVPIGNAAMADRTFVEWDKDDLDALGMLKVDILALGMLTALAKALKMLGEQYDRHWTLASLPAERKAVYAMIQRADTLGVFQIESRAQMSMLPRLRPNHFYDLVIEVAIVRPGPIQGNMVHPYLRRRQGIEQVNYPSPSPEHGPKNELEQVLGKTLGVPLFQEQAMRIAIVAAGFTPGEADKLRRAMATFRRMGTIHTFRDKMVEGMAGRGYDRSFAENCFRQIEGFGEYGFPESHAASFALLVYASAFIKCYYPDVFAASLLNAQPLGFYAPAQIVRDARDHGVTVRPPDINLSEWDATLEPGAPEVMPHPRHASMAGHIRTTHALRLGFREVEGLKENDGRLVAERRDRGYDSVRDVWLRTGLPSSTLERLADADAFASLGLSRRDALWAVRGLGRSGDKDDLPLFLAAEGAGRETEPDMHLPPMLPGEEVVMDYRHLRMSLRAHPVSFLRSHLDRLRAMPCDDLTRTADGRRVTVAGLIVVRQRPGTAKGTIFLTLEDESGIANIVVWAKVFEAHRAIVLGSRMVSVTGRMQSESGVIHVVADRIVNLTHLLGHLASDNAAAALTPPGEAVRATDKGGGLPDPIYQPPHPANAPLPAEPDVAADLDVPARATRHVPARRRA
ncbi:error-prone DNA polymerase [Pleomorphomonas sp. JP5]|uniref:error-prone DNA polymerase n=1 Tax=Pleomorphomonas sp. JP5 TaxID=2942998 RepID=UPI0020436FBA|nr:error-prone DNA polymerase [Pleomorphomonas sp. JP5]MCM5558675.1 error-prone DNA polymerase [Pleomorphomonas sp. JP5]